MPARGFSGNQTIVEGCRTCEHGIDEGDGLGCEVFCYMVKDRDFCILYNDDPSALHYFRILPRFHAGKFYKMGYDAKNKCLDAFSKVTVIQRPNPKAFEASIGISGPLLQLDVLGYLAEKQKQDKQEKQKVRKLRGQTGKPSKNRKHLDKQTQKLKNYRRKF
jgi:hypothetical protein